MSSVSALVNAPLPPNVAEMTQGVLPQTPAAGPPAPPPAETTVLQVLSAAASTAFQQALLSKGYLSPLHIKDKPLPDAIMNIRNQRAIYNILFSGIDTNPIVSMVDAALYAVGVSPKEVPISEKLDIFLKSFPAFSGIAYFILGSDTYDSLFGQAGSPMLMAKAILEAYGPHRIDGPSAVNMAQSLYMAFKMNPTLTKGFHDQDLAKILKHAVSNGLLTPTTDGNVFVRQALNILPVYASVRDALSKELARTPTTEELEQAFPIVLQSYSGIPFKQLAHYIRRDNYIKSLAPHGLFQAGVAAAGVQVPIAPEIYTKDDITLRNNIADSPIGNMVGATVRAVQVYGKRGPLGKFYEDIVSGNMPVMLPSQWISLAVRSGVPAPVAVSLLHQHERNKSFLTPDIVQSLRAAQFKYDIAPVLDQINMMYRDPELRAGAVAEYARKLGYKSVGLVDPGSYMLFLHSNHIHSGIKKVLDRANTYAALEEASAHRYNLPILRSVTQHLSEVGSARASGQPVPLNLAKAVGAVYVGPRQEENVITLPTEISGIPGTSGISGI